MHLYLNRGYREKYMSSLHLNIEWRTLFPLVYFHGSQVGYTPVVKKSKLLNIRKVEK
jgi:hypothetical protein